MKQMRRTWFALLLAFAVLWTATAASSAHPESISSIEVLIQKSSVQVSLTLQNRDLDRWFPPGGHADYKAYIIDGLKAQAGDLFDFEADGQSISPTNIHVTADQPGCVRIELTLTLPAGATALTVQTKSLDKLPPGHKQLLCAEDLRGVGKPDDAPPVLIEQALTADEDSVEIPISKSVAVPATRPTP